MVLGDNVAIDSDHRIGFIFKPVDAISKIRIAANIYMIRNKDSSLGMALDSSQIIRS